MIDFKKFNLNNKDIDFLIQIEDNCINNQNEVTLTYNGKSFVLEPRGKAVHIYAYGKDLGDYESFDDLLLNHKIDGKALIELVSNLDCDD